MDPEAVAAADRVPHGGTPDENLLDFSANTNPRTPAGVAGVYADAREASRRYPDDAYPDLRAAAARAVECDPGDVVPTPGGLAAIRLAIQTQVDRGETVIVPAPSFGEYAREVNLQGANPRFVPHDELLAAEVAGASAAIVCTPNNPTGEAYPVRALRAFVERCRAAETTVIVDEAFLGYVPIPSLAGTPGTVVARSLTKLFGLPGLRAGYAVATGDAGAALSTARRPWAVSTPAARVGAHCLARRDFVADTRSRVARERARLVDALTPAFDVHPGVAPFLLLDVGPRSVDALCSRTRARGVAIRDATTFRGLDNHVRVAIKEPADNDRLLEALDVRDEA